MLKKILIQYGMYPKNARFDARTESDGVLTEREFQGKLLTGMESLATTQRQHTNAIAEVKADLGRADKEVKAALEDLTKVKNQANASVEEIERKIKKVEKQITLCARSSFGNPLRRALADEEFRFTLNALARNALAARYPEVKIDKAFQDVIDKCGAQHKALTGVDAGLGQATVPIETFDQIYDLLLEYGDYTTLGVNRVGARTTVLPLATSRPQFYWLGAQSSQAESSQITAGAFTGGDVLLIIQTLAVLMYISRELLQDSTVDMASYVLKHMVQSMNWGMDTAAFIGTGNADTTNAGYVGIFNAAQANANQAYVAGPGRTVVAKLLLDDFVNAILTVSPEVLNRNPMWWAHAQNIARAALIRDNNGRPIFQTWLEVPNPKAIGSILGHPVHPTAIAPNVDGASTVPFTFGDPEGQNVSIRVDLELATSSDIGFPQNLMAYRALIRAGVKMLTQAASTTLKPFVNLTTAPQ